MSLPEKIHAAFAVAVAALREAKRPVAVIGHVRPDGDCIGSQVALCRYLRSFGIDALCVNTHAVPRTQRFLVGDTPFVTGMEWVPQNHIFVTVDCSDKKRIGDRLGKIVDDIFLAVDHHRSNDGFAAHNIILVEKAATCEILTELFLPERGRIDALTAQALYVGIATDTGQFEYASTSPRVFELACELVKLGASPSKTAQALYEQESFGKMQLMQRFLASLKLELGGKACVGTLTQSDYDATGTTREDSDSLINYPRSLEGVELAAVLEESNDMIKGSLRGREGAYRVDLLAAQFGGGGHAAAAGFTCPGEKLDAFYPRFLELLTQHFHTYCQ